MTPARATRSLPTPTGWRSVTQHSTAQRKRAQRAAEKKVAQGHPLWGIMRIILNNIGLTNFCHFLRPYTLQPPRFPPVNAVEKCLDRFQPAQRQAYQVKT